MRTSSCSAGWVNSAGTLVDETVADTDGTLDTVDTDYLSSRGYCNAWGQSRRGSANDDQWGGRSLRRPGPAGGFPVVLMTIVKRLTTCYRLDTPGWGSGAGPCHARGRWVFVLAGHQNLCGGAGRRTFMTPGTTQDPCEPFPRHPARFGSVNPRSDQSGPVRTSQARWHPPVSR